MNLPARMRPLLAIAGLCLVATTACATGAAETKTSSEARDTYARLCPMLDKWDDLEGAKRRYTAQAISKVATEAARSDRLIDDPEARAFLNEIPAMLNAKNKAQAAASRSLLEATCNNKG